MGVGSSGTLAVGMDFVVEDKEAVEVSVAHTEAVDMLAVRMRQVSAVVEGIAERELDSDPQHMEAAIAPPTRPAQTWRTCS